MNKRVYFLRHGESLENVKKIRLKEDEAYLTKNGILQAESVSSRLSAIDLDIVYSSPYMRAVETAKKIANDSDVEMKIVDYAYERLYPNGVYGLYKKDQKAKKIVNEFKKIWIEKPDLVPADGSESFNQFKDRIKKILKLVEENEKRDIAFVLHSSVLKALFVYVLTNGDFNAKTFFDMYKRIGYSNTGLSLFEYSKEKGWVIKIWNDHAHL